MRLNTKPMNDVSFCGHDVYAQSAPSEPDSWTETHDDHWCGMAITVTAEVTNNGGTVKSIEIIIDNEQLYNVFNGHYDEILNEYVERVTGWEVNDSVEIC